MTDLESAIQHCEEVAEENEKVALYKPIDFCVTGEIEKCTKCAEEHQQLAEWLKELKAYKEQSGDAISRQAVDDAIYDYSRSCDVNYQQIMEFIEKIPPVTPEQKIGRWITLKDEYGDVVEAVCSRCDKNGNHKWAFCPNCGARMESEDEE